METELDYTKASKAHLQAWDGLKKSIVWSTAGIILLLALLAFFFAG
ncbi:MAG: hypothetical protein AB8B77_00630 [Alphaproteobacteria bacterium]